MISQDELMEDVQNDVWEIVPKQEGKSIVSSKWIQKIEHATYGSIEKYKARFVARGFFQKKGINSEETLTPGIKVCFLQNYDGSCFHDEVKTSLPQWYDWGRFFTSNSHKDLKLKTDGLIYVS